MHSWIQLISNFWLDFYIHTYLGTNPQNLALYVGFTGSHDHKRGRGR